MPNHILVWVDPQPCHTLVYVDESLFSDDGELSRAGVVEVNSAISRRLPGMSLSSASPCRRPPLRAIAG